MHSGQSAELTIERLGFKSLSGHKMGRVTHTYNSMHVAFFYTDLY